MPAAPDVVAANEIDNDDEVESQKFWREVAEQGEPCSANSALDL
jgi:hypothetical protein